MSSAQRSGLDAGERSSQPEPPARGLRRDAQRNRDAIVSAAREVFSEQGLEAPLEEIARRAGVGIGTLYRRFPTRVDLVDRELVRRAQSSGQLRGDLTVEDLAFLNWSNARIVEATGAVAPDAWRRHLAFLLDAFRAERAHELPSPPLTPRQVSRAMLSLAVRCGRSDQ